MAFLSKVDVVLQAMPLLLKGAILTLQVAALGTIIGFLCGTIFGVLSSNRFKTFGIAHLIHVYVMIVRGTPVFVQILIVYFALPDLIGINLSPKIAGIITLGLNSTAYISEIIRGGINTVLGGQWEAGYVLGYNKIQVLYSIILPQAFRASLPSLTNELAVLVKETSLISSIGLAEMTRMAMNVNARVLEPFPIYLTVAGLYFLMTTVIGLVSSKLEKGLSYD